MLTMPLVAPRALIAPLAPAFVLIAVLLAVGAGSRAAAAPDVTPVLITGTGNQTCGDLEGAGQNWTEVKVDPNGDGTFGDGTLSVTITNTTNDKTFDWSSNIGVDAVFVKAGSTGSNLYVYDPPAESTGDDGLTSPGGGTTNGISHISFCYDLGATPTPTAPPQPTPTAAAATETPAPTASPTLAPGETAAPTPTPSPTVLAAQALPATGGSSGPGAGPGVWVLLGLMAAAAAGLAAVMATRRR